jgi:Flp pilus assembly CpaE family ATPase
VNPLLVRLAKQKGVMVGDVHMEFTKTLGSKAKSLTKEEIREKKIEWMKAELARLGKKGNAPAA